MVYSNWSTEEIGLAIKCREEGMSWAKVADALVEAGYKRRSGPNVSGTIRRIQKEYDVKTTSAPHWKDDPATRKQCKYIAGLTLTNGTKKELERLTNQLITSANKGDFTKEQATEMINALEGDANKAEETAYKERKKSKSKKTNHKRWTSDEDDIVIEWKTTKGKYPPPTLFKGRTYKAIVARWNRVLSKRNLNGTRAEYVNNHTKEDKPVTMGIATVSYPNTHKAWTYNESLEAMVMWHSLPIDEARQKFGRPYWVIAKHVEKHYDFYYDTSETIMRRATEIKNNMKTQSLPVKKSLLQRWKDRRSDRKSKKLQKKIDRTKKKLKKMEVKQ
tara:strand:+ start:14440 stop:15435 length:996 start_codon:yes stop_codon:yes gene_type:complete